MQTLGAFEAKTHFSALLEKVEKGERIVITKHGKPVAKLMPFNDVNVLSKSNVVDELKKFSATHTLDGLSWKQLRDEGKK